MKMHLKATDELVYTVNKVVTVINKNADYHSRVQIPFDREHKIKNLQVYIYDKAGKEILKIKKNEFKDLSAADGFSLYTDDRVLYYKYTPTAYPYTISLDYTIETSDTAFLPSWYFIPNYLTSVEKSYLEVKYDNQDLKPEIKEFNLDELLVAKSEKAQTLTYEANDLVPIEYEVLGPSFSDRVPRLRLRLKKFSLKGEIASAENWKELGLWMNEALLKGQKELPTETIQIAKELVNGIDDDLEKAKVIYKYVQENTRYISVQIGIGGWKPISAIEVDRAKYGDCKGLSNYTQALLNAVGVTSYYTVIWAGEKKKNLVSDFSSIQGNHAILAIPYKGDYYWIDCTSQVHPFGFVGDFTDDRLALVVTSEGGELIKTVAYVNEENYQKTNAEFAIAENGAISGKVKIFTGGIQYDEHFSLARKNHEDIIKYYKDYWSNINNLNVNDITFENDVTAIEFSESVSVDATDYAKKTGERMLFVVNPFNKNTFVPKRYRTRQTPLVIGRGYFDKDNFEIALPHGYEVEALPKAVELENEFGKYSVSFNLDATKKIVTYTRELLIKEGTYPKEKYQTYRDFRKQISRNDNAKIVLLKNTK
jgi:transglutaminase-like putative cysteine protease